MDSESLNTAITPHEDVADKDFADKDFADKDFADKDVADNDVADKDDVDVNVGFREPTTAEVLAHCTVPWGTKLKPLPPVHYELPKGIKWPVYEKPAMIKQAQELRALRDIARMKGATEEQLMWGPGYYGEGLEYGKKRSKDELDMRSHALEASLRGRDLPPGFSRRDTSAGPSTSATFPADSAQRDNKVKPASGHSAEDNEARGGSLPLDDPRGGNDSGDAASSSRI